MLFAVELIVIVLSGWRLVALWHLIQAAPKSPR